MKQNQKGNKVGIEVETSVEAAKFFSAMPQAVQDRIVDNMCRAFMRAHEENPGVDWGKVVESGNFVFIEDGVDKQDNAPNDNQRNFLKQASAKTGGVITSKQIGLMQCELLEAVAAMEFLTKSINETLDLPGIEKILSFLTGSVQGVADELEGCSNKLFSAEQATAGTKA